MAHAPPLAPAVPVEDVFTARLREERSTVLAFVLHAGVSIAVAVSLDGPVGTPVLVLPAGLLTLLALGAIGRWAWVSFRLRRARRMYRAGGAQRRVTLRVRRGDGMPGATFGRFIEVWGHTSDATVHDTFMVDRAADAWLGRGKRPATVLGPVGPWSVFVPDDGAPIIGAGRYAVLHVAPPGEDEGPPEGDGGLHTRSFMAVLVRVVGWTWIALAMLLALLAID